MKLITSHLRATAEDLSHESDRMYWETVLLKKYGWTTHIDSGIPDSYWILRQVCNILDPIPTALIRACGVTDFYIKDLGPNKSHYPNHGYYRESDNSVTLNSDIFIHPDQPDDFYDSHNYFLNRPAQTLIHELGHALDAKAGNISCKPVWMSLSGWSETPKPGLKQLRIKEQGAPEVIGEMYYDPKYENDFTRFYAKRNSYDDFADVFAFYVGGMRDKVPGKKKQYFDHLLKSYN